MWQKLLNAYLMTLSLALWREIRYDNISVMQCFAQFKILQFLCALPAWYASYF